MDVTLTPLVGMGQRGGDNHPTLSYYTHQALWERKRNEKQQSL